MTEQTEIKITTTHSDGSSITTTVQAEGVDMEVVFELMKRAVAGQGFYPDNIKEYFKDE